MSCYVAVLSTQPIIFTVMNTPDIRNDKNSTQARRQRPPATNLSKFDLAASAVVLGRQQNKVVSQYHRIWNCRVLKLLSQIEQNLTSPAFVLM